MRVDSQDVNVFRALNYLDQLLDEGVEFPDAIWKATQKYNVSAQDLQAAYDGEY